MSQNQEQIEARLAAYIDGELDAVERAEIEKHLASNPQHRKLIEELSGQRDMLQALPREKAPAEICETLQQQLERSVLLGNAGEPLDQPMRISRWPHRGAIAAIILLTAGLGFLVYKVLPSNKPPAEFAVAPKETGPVPTTLATEEPPGANTEKPLAVATAGKESPDDADKLKTSEAANDRRADKGSMDTTVAAPSPAAAPSGAATTPEASATNANGTTTPAPVAAAPSTGAPATGAPTGEVATANSALTARTPPEAAPPAGSAPPPAVATATPAPADLSNNSKLSAPTRESQASPGVPQSVAMEEDRAKQTTQPAGINSNAIAMNPSAASNSVNVTEQPLINAMNKSDPFAAKGGGFGGGGAGGAALGARQVEEKNLGVSTSATTCLIVSAADPTIANQQVRTYLADNGIAWEKTEAPADLTRDSFYAANRSRFENAQAQKQPQFAKALPNQELRYARKDVASDQPAEAEAIAKRRAYDDRIAAQKAEQRQLTTQPSAGADATATQANAPAMSGAAAPTSQPADEHLQAQLDVNGEAMAYRCPSVTPEQARALQDVLASQPGQQIQLVPAPALPANEAGDLTLQQNSSQLNAAPINAGPMNAGPINSAPATAPSSQAAANPSQPAQPQAVQSPVVFDHVDQGAGQSQAAPTMQQQLKDDVNAGNNNGFNMAQQAQITATQQQQAEPRMDLLIVVRREVSPATQPSPANAEPILQK